MEKEIKTMPKRKAVYTGKLSEMELAAKYGVSRSPVHNALAQLKSDGLVDVYPQRGTEVSYLDWAYIKQIRFMRYHIERAVLTEVIENWNGEYESAIERDLFDQKRFAEDDEQKDEFFAACDNFHYILFDSQGKGKLWNDVMFHYPYVRLRRIWCLDKDERIREYNEHAHMFTLIKNRDLAGMYQYLPVHLPELTDFPQSLQRYKEFFYNTGIDE